MENFSMLNVFLHWTGRQDLSLSFGSVSVDESHRNIALLISDADGNSLAVNDNFLKARGSQYVTYVCALLECIIFSIWIDIVTNIFPTT